MRLGNVTLSSSLIFNSRISLLMSLSPAATAGASDGAVRANGTRAPDTAGPTTTSEQNSDAKIDAENRKLDRMVKSICKGSEGSVA
jgi:hypothetical protein